MWDRTVPVHTGTISRATLEIRRSSCDSRDLRATSTIRITLHMYSLHSLTVRSHGIPGSLQRGSLLLGSYQQVLYHMAARPAAVQGRNLKNANVYGIHIMHDIYDQYIYKYTWINSIDIDIYIYLRCIYTRVYISGYIYIRTCALYIYIYTIVDRYIYMYTYTRSCAHDRV